MESQNNKDKYFRNPSQDNEPGENFNSILGTGIRQLIRGKNQDAVDSLYRAMSLNENDVRVHINLGIAFTRLGEFDKAATILKQGITVEKHPDLFTNLGSVYEKKGMFSEAFDCFNKSIAIKEDSESYMNIVRLLFTLERYDDSIKILTRIIEIEPTNITAYNNLGGVLINQKRHDEAITILSKATEQEEHPFTYEKLAIAHSRKGNYEESIGFYQKALELKHPYPKQLNEEIKRLKKL